MLGGLAVATAAGVVPFTGMAEAQSPNAGANPNASPCAPGGPNAYPPGQAAKGATTPDNTLRRGDRGNVNGCASPRSQQNHTLNSHPHFLGSSVADDTGFYTFDFTVPCDVEDGDHRLDVAGTGVVPPTSVLFNVSGTNTAVCGEQASLDAGGFSQRGAAAGGRGTLPDTGNASTAPLTAAGVGLVLIGAFAVAATRRRRAAQATGS